MCSHTQVKDPVIDRILEQYKYQVGALIPILQDVQTECEYLPRDKLVYISQQLKVPLSRIFSVATFYSSFSLAPRGRHTITLCLGTVCFLKGSDKIHKVLMETLNVEPGGTSADRQFTYAPVNCLGACALAPVMIIDDKYYNKLTPGDIPGILAEYAKEE